MNKKIFRSSLLVALLAVAASIVLILGILFSYFELQLTKELESEAEYIAAAVENEGGSYLSEFSQDSEKRITLIEADGTVIADTSADALSMPNHSDREEIKAAMETGSGTSVRYSETLTEKEVYYAKRISDGRILRVSTKQYTVITIILGLLQPIIIVIALTFIIALALSFRVSKSIVNPINKLDLEHPENNDAYDEIAPLLSKIASQKRTIEAQLKSARKQQEEFRLITENMSEGLIVIDRNMQVLTCNNAALRLFNAREPVSGNVLAVNRSKMFRETVEKVLAGEHCENEMQSDERCCSIAASPVYDENIVIGAVIVIIDITEKSMREQMRKEFTSNVSHELKTPLTSISGFAEIMMNGGVSKETVADFSKSIYDEAQRLISLVLDIIRISELDENSSAFVWEKADLYEIAENAALRLQTEAAKKDISVSVLGGSSEINGVRRILDEMIYNLCDNAIKYNKEHGTVDIIIGKSEITVRDSGIGIPKAHQNRVFERFYRVDKARSRAIGGTGLGLSIVKHGAKLHNAQIELESEADMGTEIKIKFPIMQL